MTSRPVEYYYGLALLFHGFAFAFLFLLAATLVRGVGKKIFMFFAILALVYQGGCSFAAESFGQATGGGGDSTLMSITGFGIVIGTIWLLVLSGTGNGRAVDCPSCGASIPARREKCKHCGSPKIPNAPSSEQKENR